MKKVFGIACLMVLLCAGVAQATTSTSDYYGTYSGLITIGTDSIQYNVEIGNDVNSLDLEGSTSYFWVPESTGSMNWSTMYSDSEAGDASYNGSTEAGIISLNWGQGCWRTYITLALIDDAIQVFGYSLESDGASVSLSNISGTLNPTPIPGAAWLLGSGLLGLVGLRRKMKA